MTVCRVSVSIASISNMKEVNGIYRIPWFTYGLQADDGFFPNGSSGVAPDASPMGI